MKVNGESYRTIWLDEDEASVGIIDQTRLPHAFTIRKLDAVEEMAAAISEMQVRGAPLIGAAAAYGVALAMHADVSDDSLDAAIRVLGATRPTAVNLKWALGVMAETLRPLAPWKRRAAAYQRAAAMCDEDVATCRAIAGHGSALIRRTWEGLQASSRGAQRVNILTHCNAGWLATVDWGTALAPIYLAHEQGVPVHVWVDETRPRNQGASLTAWELAQSGVPHTVIADNVGGHLAQHGLIDLCLVGSDRTTANGDVCNKIGTYLKALAARDNDVPFYVALPYSTIDWALRDGVREIPIEERSVRETTHISGVAADGSVTEVRLTPDGSPAANYAFDVTPSRLVTALITERGVCPASEEGLFGLYGDVSR